VIVRAESPLVLDDGPDLAGRRVLVVEDGPTITHGGLPFGAGTVAARRAGAEIVDPRPWAVGSIAETYQRYPAIGPVLPAMGYSADQVHDLAATVRACPCDVVVVGTPVALERLFDPGHPVRRVRYSLREVGHPDLPDVLEGFLRDVARPGDARGD
jgi:predicted GTPase